MTNRFRFSFRFGRFYVADWWKFCNEVILNRGHGNLLLAVYLFINTWSYNSFAKVTYGFNSEAHQRTREIEPADFTNTFHLHVFKVLSNIHKPKNLKPKNLRI